MDKLSVIIPIYNVELYLRQCLDSIVNQTYRNLEIILVDDGSPDNCGAICDEYAQRDDRIVVIHKPNGGVSAARNDGIDKAMGEWITFVDPDDWCEVDYYEQLFTAYSHVCEEGHDADIFFAGGCFKEYSDHTIESRGFTAPALFKSREQIDFLIAKVLIGQCGDSKNKDAYLLGSTWDKLYKTSFIHQIQQKFDTRLHPMEDLLFNVLAIDKINCVAVCDYIGYHYRQTMTSSVHRFHPQRASMGIVFVDALAEYMRHREPNELIQDAISACGIREFIASCQCYFFHKDNKNPYSVTAGEINAMKKDPVFYAAVVHNKSNRFLIKKQVVCKYILRLPWIWPLKLYYDIKKMLHR